MHSSLPADRFSIGLKPDWVSSVDDRALVSRVSPYQEHNVLEQFEWDVEKRWRYERHILNIPHTEALNALGNVEFDIDPLLHHRMVHHIRIWRNGEPRDCQLAVEQFRFFQPEEARSSQVYDGRVRAMLPIEDVRVGDVIDIASSMISVQARIPDRVSGRAPTCAIAGADLFRLRIRYSSDSNLQFSNSEFAHSPDGKDPDGKLVKLVERRDTNPISFSLLAASWEKQVDCLEWSNYHSWKDVSATIQKLWAPVVVNSFQSPEITAVAKRLYESKSTDKERIDETIRFVQNEIRYLSLSEGIRSMVPEDPVAVLSKRYGDCKDKSLLLVILLRRMKLEAWAALVSVRDQHTVEKGLPMEKAFDHAIVSVRCEGKMYWIDPTISNQGGKLENRSDLDLGMALPIIEGGAPLVKLPRENKERDFMYVDEDIRMVSGQLHIEMVTQAAGAAADSIRNEIRGGGLQRFSERMEQGMSNFYRNINSVAQIDVDDQIDGNVIYLTEKYVADQELENIPDLGACICLAPHVIAPRIQQLPREHDLPVSIPLHYPCKVHHNVSFHHDWGLDWDHQQNTLNGPGFEFEHESCAKNGVVTNRYRYETTTETIHSSQLAEYDDKVEMVFRRLSPVVPTRKSEFTEQNTQLQKGSKEIPGLLIWLIVMVLGFIIRAFLAG